MSFGEGDLHERVEELERDVSAAADALRRSAVEHQAKDERIAELESLVRELLAAYEKADANEYRPGEVTHSARYHELRGMARALGIGEGAEPWARG